MENLKTLREAAEEEANPEPVDRFKYQLLGRLVSDCKYFLGYGDGYAKHLWAGDVDSQIKKMKEIYNELKEKPEWLSLEDINNYATKMKAYKQGDFDENNPHNEMKKE